MSRSRRKTPKGGNVVCHSEKDYKRLKSGERRTRLRQLIAHGEYELAELDPPRAGYGPKDGKRWFDDEWADKYRRK